MRANFVFLSAAVTMALLGPAAAQSSGVSVLRVRKAATPTLLTIFSEPYSPVDLDSPAALLIQLAT